MQDIIRELPDVLYHHRTRLNLSQEELAERAHVSAVTIEGLEDGDAKTISLETLDQITRALGLEINIVPRKYISARPTSVGADEARERFLSRFVREDGGLRVIL